MYSTEYDMNNIYRWLKKNPLFLIQIQIVVEKKKTVPININYCLTQFDASKFFFVVRLHGGFLPNFNFSM